MKNVCKTYTRCSWLSCLLPFSVCIHLSHLLRLAWNHGRQCLDGRGPVKGENMSSRCLAVNQNVGSIVKILQKELEELIRQSWKWGWHFVCHLRSTQWSVHLRRWLMPVRVHLLPWRFRRKVDSSTSSAELMRSVANEHYWEGRRESLKASRESPMNLNELPCRRRYLHCSFQ